MEKIFEDIHSITQNSHWKKVELLQGMGEEMVINSWVKPDNPTDLAVVWYIFGDSNGHIPMLYYSVVSWLRNTDLENYSRYIITNSDYEYVHLLKIFEMYGFTIVYEPKNIKFISPDSNLLKNHKFIHSVDSDAYVYTPTTEKKEYFSKLQDFMSINEQLGLKETYYSVNTMTGVGNIMYRVLGMYMSSTGNYKTELKKYENQSEVNVSTIKDQHYEDMLFILNKFLDILGITWFDEGHKRYIVNRIILSKWSVNEVFCVNSNFYKDPLLGKLIDLAKRKQYGYWDEEAIYHIYMSIVSDYTKVSISNNPHNGMLIRHSNIPKIEDTDDSKLYIIHPYGDWGGYGKTWFKEDLHVILKNIKPNRG